MDKKTAVIFDMDGTLLDTERIYQKYWLMASKQLGYSLTAEDFLEFRSLGHSFAIEKMKEKTGRDNAYDEIRSLRRAMMEPVMEKTDIPLNPYTEETLNLLKEEGFLLAVATATRKEFIEKYLGKAGIRDYFDELISARMVKSGKPAPDVYLYACECLGLSPEDTFAVEDAPNGVLSAYAAGCWVIMVPDLTEPDEALMDYIDHKADSLMDAALYIKGDFKGRRSYSN